MATPWLPSRSPGRVEASVLKGWSRRTLEKGIAEGKCDALSGLDSGFSRLLSARCDRPRRRPLRKAEAEPAYSEAA
jgi:hypothetical protein